MDYDRFIPQVSTYVARAKTHPYVVRSAADGISRAAAHDVQRGVLSLRQAARVYMALNAVYKALGERTAAFNGFVAALQRRRARLRKPRPVRW